MTDLRSQADRWQRVQTIFRRAAELPIAERGPFLNAECGDDEQLFCEVQELLTSDVDLQNNSQDFIADAVAGGESLIGAAETEQPLPTRFGKYEVESKLGSGGFGVVYQGRDPTLRRSVAIKVCSSPDEEVQRRFYREGRIAAGLRHPNITTVFEMSVENGVPFMVQELLHGQDLQQILKAGSGLDFAQLVGFLLQTARGLENAHSAGVLHRDIKPANIRILPDGSVKLMDFGIAKLLGAETGLTVDGTTLGTVGYLAPEQLRSEPVDERADIFSFGVVAYELLTGERPFRGKDFSQVSYQLLYEDPAPILDRWRACPVRLARLVHQCLAKRPIDRPGSFAPVLRELEKLEKEAQESAAALRAPSADSDGSPMTATTPWTESAWSGSFGGGTSWARILPRDLGSPLIWLSVVSLLILGGAFFWWAGSGSRPVSSPDARGGVRTSDSENVALVRGAGSPGPPVSKESELPAEPVAADPESPGLAEVSNITLELRDPKQTESSAPSSVRSELPPEGERDDWSEELEASDLADTPPSSLDASGSEAALEDRGESSKSSFSLPSKNPEGSFGEAGVGDPVTEAATPVENLEIPSGSRGELPSSIPDTEELDGKESGLEVAAVETSTLPSMTPGDLITAEGPGVELPSLLSLPEPDYPRRARRRGIEGRIVVKVLVDENGKVLQAIAPGRDEHGFLAAAREAARGARFEPATRDGIVGRMWTHLPVEFSLGEHP